MGLKNHIIKINLPGGIIAAGDLYDIVIAAERAKVQHIRFGNRQQLYFTVGDEQLEDLEYSFLQDAIIYETDQEDYPNIMSSYVAEDIFEGSSWVREGVYKDILDLFTFTHRLKINLADNNQTFIPFFTGNLNFIASDISNYWYLYIRFQRTNTIYCWPGLIYSDDVPVISKAIENVMIPGRDNLTAQNSIGGPSLFKRVCEKETIISQSFLAPLKIPPFQLPVYEGFHAYGKKLWLGIYRRNELFEISFLKEVCALCLKSRVGEVYITPWKSIIIKGIEAADKYEWDGLLNRYGINAHHALSELNWQTEDHNNDSLDLKNELAGQLNVNDQRTDRLCFAITSRPKYTLFGSVIIRKTDGRQNREPGNEYFDIVHTKDFNPNTKELVLYQENINRKDLADHLAALCRKFYHDNDELTNIPSDNLKPAAEEIYKQPLHQIYQCKHCLSVYDEAYGDPQNEIEAGTKFENINSVYVCPTCEAPKSDFLAIEKTSPVYLQDSLN